MKVPITKLKQLVPNGSTSGRFAVAHWDRENIYFLVISSKSTTISDKDFGIVSLENRDNPFVALSEHFARNSIQANRIVAILSRPELDLPTLSLPPADDSELPGLIAIEVEQQLGESDEPAIVDYHVVHQLESDSSSGIQVLAFALPARELKSLEKQVAQAGLKLAAICSRHMAPLGLLQRSGIPDSTLAVAVHLYAGEVELALCRGSEPILLRTIRISQDDMPRVADQIWMELQRCMTLLPAETVELDLVWYVFRTSDASVQVAQALRERDRAQVQLIDPMLGWDASNAEHAGPLENGTATAANTGAGWDFLNRNLAINMLAPKQPPRPKNPMIRWMSMGAAALGVIMVGIYFLLDDLHGLRDDVASLEAELTAETKVTAKYQEKADQVAAIQDWLSDQVNWLAELNDLSTRIPNGQHASVRRLSASANSKTAVIDLSVQVAEQEYISQLEAKIRSAKHNVSSKQISQNPDSSEYPWQFETRITFPIEPVDTQSFVTSLKPVSPKTLSTEKRQ